jgi:hypothetical protein
LFGGRKASGPIASKVAVEELAAGDPAPAVPIGLDELQPSLDSVDLEHRADFVPLELRMLVIGGAEADSELVEKPAAEIELAAQVASYLLEPDRDGHIAMLFLASLLLFTLAMAVAVSGAGRNAVIAVEPAHRHAQIAAIADISEAGAQRLLLGGAVGEAAAQRGELERFGRFLGMALLSLFGGDLQLLGAKRRRKDEAAGAKVVALAIAAVDVEHHFTQRHVRRDAEASLVSRGAIGADRIDMDGLVGNGARDAPVEHVDRPADRLASEQQHRRAVQHLDPVGRQRIDRDRVVGRRARRVDRADAVSQDADALALKAAKHRPGRAGAERGRGYARLAHERVAELRPQIPHQLGASQHAAPREQIKLAHKRRGDDDLVRLLLMDMVAALRLGLGLRPRLRRLLSNRGGREQSSRHKQERAPFHQNLRLGGAGLLETLHCLNDEPKFIIRCSSAERNDSACAASCPA